MDKYTCMMCGHIYDPAVGETKAFSTILCNTDRMEEYECKVMAAKPIPPRDRFQEYPGRLEVPLLRSPEVLLPQDGTGHPDRNADDQLLM